MPTGSDPPAARPGDIVSALDRIAEAAAREEDPLRVLAVAAEAVATAFAADTGRIARFHEGAAEVIGTWGVGSPPIGARFPLDGTRTLARVAITGLPARVDDYAALRAAEESSRQAVPAEFTAGISAPVISGGRLWGAVLVASTLGGFRFPEGAEHRLADLLRLAGMGLAGAVARMELGGGTVRTITGLPGRRAFDLQLGQEVERARASGTALSLVVADLDGFRRVNETLGRGRGDHVLAQVARRIAAALPRATSLAHLGGGEFAWLMPGADAVRAARVAREVGLAVSRTPVDGAGTLTIACGVCDLARTGGGARELRQLADVALFEAKHTGPGAVYRYSPEAFGVISVAERAQRVARHRALVGIRMLGRAVDARDPATQRHSQRVSALAARLALLLGWGEEDVALAADAALVHDVGKIGVPDAVLLKPGPLDPDERRTVQAHAALGGDMVREVLTAAQADWVRHHHERIDGAGYPDGLAGDDVSEGARILAVAEAVDAMTEDRPWRRARTLAAAVAECEAHAGTQFCPRVVAALRAAHDADDLGMLLGNAAERGGDPPRVAASGA